MEILDILKNRFSCRKFSDKKIEYDKLYKILEAGRIAPTACNKQPQRIIVFNSKESIERINKAKKYNFNEQLSILISYDKNECWVREIDNESSGIVDATIVATHMMIEAKSLGIDSTWIMNFNPTIIKNEFNLDSNIIPVALLVMGYKEDDAVINERHYSRKELNETTKII